MTCPPLTPRLSQWLPREDRGLTLGKADFDEPLVPENEIGISEEEPKPNGRDGNQRGLRPRNVSVPTAGQAKRRIDFTCSGPTASAGGIETTAPLRSRSPEHIVPVRKQLGGRAS